MEELFDIEKFNVISDEENYYFFRSLEPGDIEDLEKGIIKEGDNYTRIRTDRERWEETHQEKPRWNSESKVTLEEMYNHIKMHYSLQTNCISLSSNANVARTYGEAFSDKYVMIKVPKREMGEKVFHAGKYMLHEIQKQVEQVISDTDIPERIMEDLKQIDEAETSDEIKEIIKARYKSEKELDASKKGLKKGIAYKSPHARVSSYQSLNEEQTLEKNKIIAKLTVLEHKKIMKPLMSRAANNNLLIQTVGSSFSSSEQIYYGDIEGDRITDISKEVLDMFGLLQQSENQDKQIVDELKRELIKFVNEGKKIEILDESIFKRDDKVKEDITIDEMYELTEGKVEYGQANSIVKNMFYLAKGQANARALAQILKEITNDNPRYERVIEYIENNGFEIEPKISTRQSNKGYRLSESVNLNLKSNEIGLVEQIKGLTDEEQIEILENGGLSNVRDIMTSNFAQIQRQEQISRDEYYAEAIFSSYDWHKIGIEEFTVAERNNLLQKIQDEHCVDLYKKLEEKGIARKDITTILLNIVTRRNDFEIEEEDTNESIKEKRLEQYDKIIEENISDLNQELSIERIERFLGYYDIQGTGIQLRPYQQRAVEKTDEIFKEERFASVILPTGAGKSFVTLAQLLEHKDEEMLYLAPQNEILEQMKDYIIKYIHGPVNTIGRTKDEIVADIFPNLKFSTYPGLLAKDGEEIINKEYGFVVLDELHRTGAKEWGDRLNTLIDNQTESTKVLGITATPRRDADGINMANEMAERLGYTNKEAVSGKHIAMNMSLTNAIRMGLVVNPKLVSCAYTLKTDGSLDKLKGQIDQIEDVQERNKKLEKYETLRRNLEEAEGIPEILQTNVKKGGKYIVFLPIVDEIEDEDGNVIGRKKGKDKLADYEKQIAEYFKGSDITPNFHSMLGEYGDKDNERRLEEFQNRNTDDTEFMLVMNKANEGLHLDKLDGMIWLRPMDENSRILYLQQLGRVIYSEDPDNPTKDEDRPVVIDLVNNTLKVNWDNEITEQDDIEMLNIIVDWAERHDGTLPDINSTDKEETGYATVLKEIQNKYKEYLDYDFEDLNDKQIEEVQEILRLGSLIDLWQSELPDRIAKNGESHGKNFIDKDGGTFELTGLVKDFVELEKTVNETLEKSVIAQTLEIAEILYLNGVDLSKIQLMTQKHFFLLKEIKQEGVDILKIIEKNGLDENFPFGKRVCDTRTAYNGNNSFVMTEKEKRKAEKIGLIVEKQSIISQTIKIAKILLENGVDINKIKMSTRKGNNRKFTLLKDIKQDGVDIQRIIEENELDGNFPYGKKVGQLRNAYKGIGTCAITEEERKEVEKLGLIPEDSKSMTAQTIGIAKILSDNGVDIGAIQLAKYVGKKRVFTALKEIKQEGIDILKIIEENGLNGDFPLGRNITTLRGCYKGYGNIKIADNEKKEIEKLGIVPKETKSIVAQTIEISRILSNNGIDLNTLKFGETRRGKEHQFLLKELQAGEINILKIIQENGLDGEFPYGQRMKSLRRAYNGTGSSAITDEERREAEKLGLVQIEEKKSIVAQTLEVAKILKANGVKLEKIQSYITKDGKHKSILLREIEQEGIDIERIIEENGLDEDFPYGKNVTMTRMAYKGKSGYAITEQEKRKAMKLGLILEEKQSIVAQTLEVARILRANGVDLGKIKLQIKGKFTSLKEIEQEGIDIEKIIKENGLDEDFAYGKNLSATRLAYNGKGTYKKMTDEEKKEAEELGLIKIRERTGKQIAEASISSLKDIEMADNEDVALKKLAEKTKEGGIKIDEQS